MKKNVSKIIGLVLVALLVFSIAGTALADTIFATSGNAYARVTTVVYSGPGTNNFVMGYIGKGDEVTVLGLANSSWAQIRLSNGGTGYVSTGDLQFYSSTPNPVLPPTSSGDVYAATRPLNVRSGPGTNYSIVMTLNKGDQVTRIGQDGKWYKVATANNSAAWVSSVYLAPVSGGSSGGSNNATGSYNMYATTGVNVRSGASTKYNIVGGLNRGDGVTAVGTSGSWTKIQWGSGYAYVFTKYLQGSYTGGGSSGGGSTSTGSYTMYATTGVNIRSGASTKYNIVGGLNRGDSVTAVGTSGSWTKILLSNNSYGFVFTKYLQSAYIGGGSSGGTNSTGSYTMYATTNVNLRSGPGNDYSVIGSLTKGQAVTATGTNGNWTQIRFGSSYAYVYTSYLSSSSYGSVVPPDYGTTQNSNAYVTRTTYFYNSAALTSYHGTFVAGDRIEVLYYSQNGYSYVRYSNMYGYVNSNDISLY
ncbi:MAG: SH3 domain-containing protein [Christensenellaceae bacterium]|jgi:uncharacterized protein YgiM (DUF1202 family)|nr:SH3 domain-containing protein [Christensenellaceae bacterium]